MSKQLTIKEALDQGYTYCGWSKREWQSLLPLEDVSNEDFEERSPLDGKLVLAEKQSHSYTFSEETIKDFIMDSIGEGYRQECQDDTNEIESLVEEIDFTDIVDTINEKISVKKWWNLTDIRLVPNEK